MRSIPSLDTALLHRYDRPGPRYTSYPTAPQFTPRFGETQYRAHAGRSNEDAPRRRLSLYAHIPFCFSPCFYCGCNRVVTHDRSRGERYVEVLRREIESVAPLFARGREVVQLHLGGGTPNFLATSALGRLLEAIDREFALSSAPERDFSIELDPRFMTPEYAATLAALGFNRASLGVQDFDAPVQDAVNRLQSLEQTLAVIDACRAHGFRSLNIDLIYGLPRQTLAGFSRTLRSVIATRPDRIAVYGYAHLPELFKPQRQIDPAELPPPESRLELLRLAIEELGEAGYCYVGMDHFALPGDDLVRAQLTGDLQRNFMGYTTHADCDLIGLGVSAISHIGRSFSQNHRELPAWEAALGTGRLPVWRGLELDDDDVLRGDVIQRLMCRGEIDIGEVEHTHGVRFGSYFAKALEQLRALQRDELVEIDALRIAATARGRLLLRTLAMCFDRYLDQPRAASAVPRYSKVV
jgi:oxygen-independent coproporphyrinogen-3 oxidase